MPDDRLPVSLYERDLDAWSMDQASALRAVGNAIRTGQIQTADLLQRVEWDNLAEEIEGFARKDRRELASRIANVVEHLTKLQFSRHSPPRAGWIDTVRREREEISEILYDSPSLRREVPGMLSRRADAAIRRAVTAFASHGETTDTVGARLAAGYEPEQVLGDWLPAEPRG